MKSNYDLLLDKINEFTQKFYLNKLLRGSIYATAAILAVYLLLFLFIYYMHPGVALKTFLFFFFMVFSVGVIIVWVIRPGLAYFKLGKNLSIEQAAKLIGDHFFNVKDKLLNTLQLKVLADQQPQNQALILAGIDQKILALKPIPFSSAIRLQDNRKYIRFILFPLSVILLIGILAPAILKEGTTSFIRYDKEILPKAPFEFILINGPLRVTQGDDLTVKLKLNGNEFPNDIYIEDGVNTYKIEKESISRFHYTFKNVQKNKRIRFSGGGFQSAAYTLSVNPRPSLLGVRIDLVYPAYLNRKKETISNAGDLLVPEGTRITWAIQTENSSSLLFLLGNKTYPLTVRENAATFTQSLKSSGHYRIIPKNTFSASSDSLTHLITVVADQHPVIEVKENTDSLSTKALYFSGHIADDYGFSSLNFRYTILQDGKILSDQRLPLAIKKDQPENSFFYLWDLNAIPLKAGQQLSYYFEVADNDGVNGPKVTRSATSTYQVPSAQEMAAKIAEGSEVLKKKVESTIKLAATIEKESKKLSQNLLDKKQLSYEDKKQIEQLLEKQKQLDQAVREIKKQNEKNTFIKEENNTLNEELKAKQKQINDLFNNVLDEKTRELLQKLQQLMEQNSKDLTREELSKMQLDNKTVKNELDRILELYKQLEFEQNLQNKIDRLNELAREQKALSRESKNKNADGADLRNKQDELQKEFKSLQDELEKLEQKNQELDRPNPFQNPEKQTRQIEKKQQESKDQLNQNNREKAAEKQEEAAQQMQELAQQLQEEQAQQEEQESKVNARELRRLLENLLTTSFEQEKVMLAFRKMTLNDPSYVNLVQQQNTIKDNMKGIADSLFSLSRRVPQIESTVSTEVDKINFNIGKAIDQLGDRRTAEANRYQQMAMTSLNNLALMLNEALSQLQKSMKNSKSGKAGKQNMQQLQKMQEQLNKNMQQAKEQIEREGNKGTVPKGQMSEEFAKMARQQQMIREALQKINSEENKDGKGSLGDLNQAIKDMKQTENDLVNKKIEQETLNRQKKLLTKLLDAEKAQRDQDEDSKRESRSGKDFPPSYQQMLENFKKQQQNETELIQKLPPSLNFYYKNKIAEYFKILNSLK